MNKYTPMKFNMLFVFYTILFNSACLSEKITDRLNSAQKIPRFIWSKRLITELSLEFNTSLCMAPYEVPSSVKKMKNLKELDIGPCLTKSLAYIFELKKLEYLDLSCITSYQIQGISKLANLRYLNLRVQAGTVFPDEICELTKLKALYLAYFLFTDQLPAQIINLTELEIFELDRFNFKEFPEQVFSFKKLIKLGLKGCNISSFSSRFNELKYLEVLDLSYNRLTEFPPLEYIPKSLQEINLRGNMISKIPDNIDKYSQLKTIWISKKYLNDQQIQKLTEGLPSCKIIFDKY